MVSWKACIWKVYYILIRFKTIDIIDKVTSPLLIIHGKNDKVIPWKHSLALMEKCKSAAKLVSPERMEHNYFNTKLDIIANMRENRPLLKETSSNVKIASVFLFHSYLRYELLLKIPLLLLNPVSFPRDTYTRICSYIILGSFSCMMSVLFIALIMASATHSSLISPVYGVCCWHSECKPGLRRLL